MHSILEDPKDHVVGSPELDVREFYYTLGGRHIWPQRTGLVEALSERPRCLSGISAVRVVGCRSSANRHCLSGFWMGWDGISGSELHRIKLIGLGK